MQEQAPSLANRTFSPAKIVGVLIALMLVSGAIAWWNYSQDRLTIDGVVAYPDLESGVASGPVSYAQSPPVGGKYAAEWQNCGYYPETIPNETTVHSLARGAVWLTYPPGTPATMVSKLRELLRGQTHLIISPNPGQQEPVVATAWGYQLRATGITDPRVLRFISQYQRLPNVPESGTCRGGVGDPIRR